MIKIFFKSFNYKKIMQFKNVKKSIMVLYFIILVLIIAFPLNYQIIRNDGFRGLNTFTYDLRVAEPAWLPNQLPADITISRSGMDIILDRQYDYEVSVADKTMKVIINPDYPEKQYRNAIVFEKQRMVYYNERGSTLVGEYQNLNQGIDFSQLRAMEKTEAVNAFCDFIDQAYNPYTVFYSISVHTLIQFVMNTLLVFVLSLIMLFIRINYKKVTTFGENINIVIAAMTVPSIIAFIVGIIGLIELNSFAVVIFQFLTPIIALLAVYKGSPEKESSTKYL